MIGNWVSRILKSNSYEEFLKNANLIKMEMSIFLNNIKENISQNSIEKIEKLKLMIETDHPCFDDFHKKWARWMRLGCPTTSNSIEAIHHHINS